MTMKTRIRFYFIPVLIFTLSGCSSSKLGSLELDSVMTIKAKQEAMAKIESTATHQYSPQALSGMRDALETSGLKTPEIILLTLPSSFLEFGGPTLEKHKKDTALTVPPFAEILWEHRETGLKVFVGRADMKALEVTRLTRSEFITGLGEITKSYDEIYRKDHSSQASGKTEELGNLIKHTVTGKFLEGVNWHTDRRIFYLFKPEYRLTILISGKDEALEASETELQAALQLLEKRLTQLYPDAILFKAAS